MPLFVRETLAEIGDEYIQLLQLGRTPIPAAIRKVGDFLSRNKFSETVLELGVSYSKKTKACLQSFSSLFLQYDELWHNYLLITIGTRIKYNAITQLVHNATTIAPRSVYVLEKGPRVQLQPAFPDQFALVYNIPLNSDDLTVNNFMTRAVNQDKNFFTFDASDTNTCQSFVENILDSNNLTKNIVDQATLLALKPQNTTALVAALGSYKGMPKLITDLAGNLDKLINDKKIKWTPRKPKQIVTKWYLT